MYQPRERHRAIRKPASPPTRAFWRRGRFPLVYPSMLVLLCLVLATPLRADTISGTVKDPSGAVVAGARIDLTGGNLSQPLLLTSDESGKFVAANLGAGQYSIRVAKEGRSEERRVGKECRS